MLLVSHPVNQCTLADERLIPMCSCATGFGGAVSWTDAMDDSAKTCASWAITGEPDTAYRGM